MFIEIPVAGRAALVDMDLARLLLGYNWRIDRDGYAVARKGRELIAMHRLVMRAKRGQIVDHRSHDRLDNRRLNLRFATPLQNAANAKRRCDNTSGFKGVTWNANAKRWKAQVRSGEKRLYLGYFEDPAEAAIAYDRKAIELFGEFAYLNFTPQERLRAVA